MLLTPSAAANTFSSVSRLSSGQAPSRQSSVTPGTCGLFSRMACAQGHGPPVGACREPLTLNRYQLHYHARCMQRPAQPQRCVGVVPRPGCGRLHLHKQMAVRQKGAPKACKEGWGGMGSGTVWAQDAAAIVQQASKRCALWKCVLAVASSVMARRPSARPRATSAGAALAGAASVGFSSARASSSSRLRGGVRGTQEGHMRGT